MSKSSKIKVSELRQAAKRRRKEDNAYKRLGPKGHQGKRQRKASERGTFTPRASRWVDEIYPIDHAGPKKQGAPKQRKYAKLPLRPLRKRRPENLKKLNTTK